MSSNNGDCNDEVDFEKHRKVYEEDEHWNLRKSFLKAHWDKFSEDEILCLAQVFVNVEFLGCKYPLETMQRVSVLAKEVKAIQRYRASRRNNLKRTFVGAQDAVQAKLQKTTAPTRLGNGQVDLRDEDVPVTSNMSQKTSKMSQKTVPPLMRFNPSQKADNFQALLRDVIYFEAPAKNDLNGSLNRTTATMQKIGKLEMKFDPKDKKYFYIFDGQIVGEGTGDSKKTAKKVADENFAATLKANCYTIKTKVQYFSAENVITPKNSNDPNNVVAKSGQLQENNLGFKMLKMLGWKGEGLGSKGEGIVDPINLEIKIGRRGLGADNSDQFDHKHIRNILRNFKNNQVEYDLVFSNEFTKEERAKIHLIAQSMNLRAKSYGKDIARHLVISSKLTPQLLRQKLLEGDSYLLEKYEIIPPQPALKTKEP